MALLVDVRELDVRLLIPLLIKASAVPVLKLYYRSRRQTTTRLTPGLRVK